MNAKSIIAAAAAIIISGAAVSAQSQSFKLGQWTEIQNSILKELNRSYVDSLPVDRIERAGINAMLDALDPYTIYIPEEENEDLQMMVSKSYGGIGAVIYKPDKDGNVIINEPYKNSPAEKHGLRCGDEILEIDGQTTHGLTSQEASDKMKGKPGTTVVFKVKKVYTGEIVDINVTRERIHLPDVEYAGMIDSETGYIYQSGFTENVSGEIRSAVLNLKKQGMKRLVLDLRGNGGGLMSEAINIVSLFVPKGSLVVSSKGKGAGEQQYKTTSEPIVSDLSPTTAKSKSPRLNTIPPPDVASRRLTMPNAMRMEVWPTFPTHSPTSSRQPMEGRSRTAVASPRMSSLKVMNTAA